MTTAFVIRSLIEFSAIILLIFGYIHEEKVIAFEQAVKRIVIGNIRRYIRIKNHKKAVARGEHLRLHTTHSKADSAEVVVA
ncbi:MAG: hypothetical protein J1F23_02360 [Oscillospiraceae bacterium]|nr:hypothetical protein [Oscillospiraceae bacterium]